MNSSDSIIFKKKKENKRKSIALKTLNLKQNVSNSLIIS